MLLPKTFHRDYADRLGLLRAISNRHIRRVLRRIVPSMRKPEWVPPTWLVDLAAMRSSLTVIKINQSPAFARWVLRQRPDQKVLHIVRHPAAYLRSWKSRYLETLDTESVRSANIERLRLVAVAEPEWGERFGDLERLSADESELWFWLYSAESIHLAGGKSQSYRRVLDEEVAMNALSASRSLYSFWGLEWTSTVEQRVADRAAAWAADTARWTDIVSADQAETVRRVVANSEVWSWWADDQMVSGFEYPI